MGGLLRTWGGMSRQFLTDLRGSAHVRRLLLASGSSQFIAGLLIPAFPLLMRGRNLGFLQVGGIFSAIALSSISVQLLAGRHQRVFGRPGVVIALLLVTGVMLPLYLLMDTPLGFLLVNGASTWCSAAAGPGLNALIARLAGSDRPAAFYAYFGTVSSFVYAFGVIAGGLLLGAGFAPAFLLASLISCACAIAFAWSAWKGRPKVSPSPPSTPPVGADAFQSAAQPLLRFLSTIARDRRALEQRRSPTLPAASANVRWLFLHTFLFAATLSLYPIYFPIYLSSLGLPLPWVGVAVAASWIVYGLCQPFGARFADRTGRHRDLIVVSLLGSAALNAVMARSSLGWVIAAWVLLGITDGIGRPSLNAMVAAAVPATSVGTAFGWNAAAFTLARILAPFAIAAAIVTLGFANAFMAVAAALAVSTLPLLMVRLPGSRLAPAAAPIVGGEAA
jgi:MFS family permease